MKKTLVLLLSIAMLLSTLTVAIAEKNYIGDMLVVNCDEWVSMREEPDTSSSRLIQVPLGALVTECYWVSPEFVYGQYNGSSGYILSEYLEEYTSVNTEPAEETMGFEAQGNTMIVYVSGAKLYAQADMNGTVLADLPERAILSDCHTYNADFVYCEYQGQVGYVSATDLTVSDMDNAVQRIDETHFLHTERIYGGYDETLRVSVDDASGNTVWETTLYQPQATELTSTEAFVNDKNGDALVMLYNAAEGLSAADAFTGTILWTLPPENVDLGASITYAIDGYGTMYIGGYYGPDPVAISREGKVLWQANSGSDDIYWLYKIALDEKDGVIASYEVIGDNSGQISYGWDGTLQWIREE